VRLSIIIPYLNSHEIVRRNLVYIREQDYPDDVEIVFLDDGSDPPLEMPADPPKNFTLYATNEFRKWTWAPARNKGAKLAKGEYLFMVDGDYIISREAVEIARQFDSDRLGVRRVFGVLTEECELSTDPNILVQYGLLPDLAYRQKKFIPPHPNQFVIRKSVFEMMGGYDEVRTFAHEYPQREDNDFKRRLRRLVDQGTIQMPDVERPVLYMYPNGQFCGDVDHNPFGLFHGLTRKTDRNHWYQHPRYKKAET